VHVDQHAMSVRAQLFANVALPTMAIPGGVIRAALVLRESGGAVMVAFELPVPVDDGCVVPPYDKLLLRDADSVAAEDEVPLTKPLDCDTALPVDPGTDALALGIELSLKVVVDEDFAVVELLGVADDPKPCRIIDPNPPVLEDAQTGQSMEESRKARKDPNDKTRMTLY